MWSFVEDLAIQVTIKALRPGRSPKGWRHSGPSGAEGGQAHGHIADGSPEHPDASKLQTQVCEGIMILSGRQRLSRKAEPNIDWERNI